LGHEAYRNGVVDRNNEAETVEAVKGHTEMADRMRSAGYSFNAGGVVGTDLAAYDYARSVGDMSIMDAYADMFYNSDGDYLDLISLPSEDPRIINITNGLRQNDKYRDLIKIFYKGVE
jgi:hypothetical protein